MTIEEPEIAEEPTREASVPAPADEGEESPDLDASVDHEAPVDDDPAPVERATFDSIEATHPIVVEKRALEAARILDAEIDEPSVDDAGADGEAAGDDPALPGEDRGVDSVEVTRPIAVDEQVEHVAVPVEEPGQDPVMDTAEEPFEESAMETSDESIEAPVEVPVVESAEASVMEPVEEPADGPAVATIEETEEPDQLVHEGTDDTDGEETYRRHGLEHGVPLPTMTLAKLALEQDDRRWPWQRWRASSNVILTMAKRSRSLKNWRSRTNGGERRIRAREQQQDRRVAGLARRS